MTVKIPATNRVPRLKIARLAGVSRLPLYDSWQACSLQDPKPSVSLLGYADPIDGTTNVDGAIWGEGTWHLVEITAPHGRGYRGELLASQAVCSCGWSGVQRWMRSSDTEATDDGEYHTWMVSHR